MENKDEQKRLEKEKAELNALINKGIHFDVNDVEMVCHKAFFGLKKRYAPKGVSRRFTIEEPTLATLDRLSAEWIEFAIDDSKSKTQDGMEYARTMVANHSIRCARIVAIAVLGNSRLVPKSKKGMTVWVEDEKKIEELTQLFARAIKPSKLHSLCTMINAMCNLGDFMNSIRLMSTERTTMPILIEGSSTD